jgi:2-oxoisovalerate dehydrogenase E1 component subunit alpha
VTDTAVAPCTHRDLGLSDQQAVKAYRLMLITRALDERIWALNRQGQVGITVPSRGHEAAQVGCALAFQPGRDVFLPYYRDLGLIVGLGYSADELMLDVLGRAAGPFSGGRQMPFHWSDVRRKVLTLSSSVGTQIPHAVGAALAARLRGERCATLVTFGDGATSKGDFHEALNFAAIHRLGVVFYCENNQYAISVPLDHQMQVPNVADRAVAYGMPGRTVDGNDLLAVHAAARAAVAHVLEGNGPILLEAKTYRLLPHTSNDDDSTYRTADEVALWRTRDPIPRYRAYLLAANLLDPTAADALAAGVEAEVDAAARRALTSPEPSSATALEHLYAPGTPNAPRLDASRNIPTDQVQSLQSEIGA